MVRSDTGFLTTLVFPHSSKVHLQGAHLTFTDSQLSIIFMTVANHVTHQPVGMLEAGLVSSKMSGIFFTRHGVFYPCVCRDDGIDPKYLQPTEMPPSRLPMPGVSRGGAVGRGMVTGGALVRSGGSALTNSLPRNNDRVQAASINRPVLQRPPQFSSQPPQLLAGAPPVRPPQVPLTSSYFPQKS